MYLAARSTGDARSDAETGKCGMDFRKIASVKFLVQPTSAMVGVPNWQGDCPHGRRTMVRAFRDTLRFLIWLAVLTLAKLVVIGICLGEIVLLIGLWPYAVIHAVWGQNNEPLVWACVVTAAILLQYVLWQYLWLRVAHRGGAWRGIAEYFSSIVRYPVVRMPHRWE